MRVRHTVPGMTDETFGGAGPGSVRMVPGQDGDGADSLRARVHAERVQQRLGPWVTDLAILSRLADRIREVSARVPRPPGSGQEAIADHPDGHTDALAGDGVAVSAVATDLGCRGPVAEGCVGG